MTQIFGDFIEESKGQGCMLIQFSPQSTTIRQRWRQKKLSASFLADYWATFFDFDDLTTKARQIEIKDAVRFISNELLENAMKYSYHGAEEEVKIGLYLHQNNLIFYLNNYAKPPVANRLRAFIQELHSKDIDELYLLQLEDEENTGSGLGFLTMINDYQAQLAWKFSQNDQQTPEIIKIITMVQLTA